MIASRSRSAGELSLARREDRFYAAIPGLPTTYELEKISFDLIRRSMADALKPPESSASVEKIGAAEKE